MKAASDISLFRNTNTQIVLLALAAIGIALRLFISWHVIGSNDAKLWEMHAIRVTHQGLLAAYDNYWFNHPPLSALGMTFLYWLAERVSVAPYFLFRLPGIIADAGSCLLIYRIISARKTPHDGAWAAALFSLCPLAIAISGYHCNTDSVYIFLCLLAAYYLTERNNATAGGVALGAAINIKLIPVLFIPAYYRYCRNHEQRLSFTLALAICAVPFLIPLLAATEPVVRHMLLYRSTYDWWGLRAAYYAILQPFGEVDASMQVLPSYSLYGRLVIVSAIGLFLYYHWRVARWNIYQASAIISSLFLILTPGFGAQYLIAPLPFLFVAHRGWAVAYGVTAGIFAAHKYCIFWTGTIPAYSALLYKLTPPLNIYLGLFTWCLLIACCAAMVLKTPKTLEMR